MRLVSPVVDAATATFKVTLEVNDPKGDLKPGMFARVGIVFERRADALTIPRIALLDTDGASNVFVVTDGKAEQRAIKTGLSNAGRIEVSRRTRWAPSRSWSSARTDSRTAIRYASSRSNRPPRQQVR